MGSYEERLIRDGETQILLVTGNEMDPVVAKYEDDLKALLNRYRDLFGRSARSRFLMLINHASYDGAGAFPSSISIETTETASSVSDADAPKLLYLLAHETLHLWNGRLLKSAGQIEWFKEGFTDYYSWMTMYRAGQISQEVLFAALGERIDRYQKAAGSVSISAAGREKSKNYGIVYYGGLTPALLLDLGIRSDTKGQKSLDGVMRGLAE
ncbi:MAG TPA: hypothetical protein EYN96_09915 [Candidatus Hydrogenedentes bacterium]|nr:hypothetical protein [Candidatus Hydrogenedentota bacterium]